MANYEEAIAAKKKFKTEYWKKSKDIFNIIMIEALLDYDEEKDELMSEDYKIKVYLFDITDAEKLPKNIEGVEIVYEKTV